YSDGLIMWSNLRFYADLNDSDRAVMEALPSAARGVPDAPVVSGWSETDGKLHWTDDSDNIAGFVIERQVESGDWLTVGTVGEDEPYWSDPAAYVLTPYSYRVRAFGGGGVSAPSEPTEFASHSHTMSALEPHDAIYFSARQEGDPDHAMILRPNQRPNSLD